VIIVVLAVAWLFVAVTAALLLGAAIRIADGRAPLSDHLPVLPSDLTVDDVLGIPRRLPTAH
jgi:hypothetical protein